MTNLINNNNDFVSSQYFNEDYDEKVFDPTLFTNEGASWCYMHGQLEEDNHWDCFLLNKKVGIKNDWVGMFPLKFNGKECTFFKWVVKMSSTITQNRGLIVYNDDKEAFEYAKKAFLENREML